MHDVGSDPDARFSFANERTFLAWNRTALALIAAGLAVTTLLPKLELDYGRRIIGVPLIALGALLAWTSYRRWEDNERAMRLGEPLPASNLPRVLGDRHRTCHGARRDHCPLRVGLMPDADHSREPPEDNEVFGSEVARTDLAWNRSGLALAVAAAAILKVVVDISDFRAPVIILLVLVAGAIAWALAIVEARAASSSAALVGRLLADQRKLKFVATLTCRLRGGCARDRLLPNT